LSAGGWLAAGMSSVLILGGTTEARGLAERLAKRADREVVLSLAGRTVSPAPLPVPVRRGGFGGGTGLAHYLIEQRIDAMVDATHPYARIMSVNAAAAARTSGIAFVALRRPPWLSVSGDRWDEAADASEAVRILGERPRRVFVALGRNGLAPFVTAPQHYYLIRSVDPVDPPLSLSHAAYVRGRGPFSEADDRALLLDHAIDIVVAKNSGGTASYGKIVAARALGIPVIMLRRPPVPAAPTVETVDDAIVWLDHALTSVAARGV
jgi:precorrin-6A/cobalt-precorrin-6A reductase